MKSKIQIILFILALIFILTGIQLKNKEEYNKNLFKSGNIVVKEALLKSKLPLEKKIKKLKAAQKKYMEGIKIYENINFVKNYEIVGKILEDIQKKPKKKKPNQKKGSKNQNQNQNQNQDSKKDPNGKKKTSDKEKDPNGKKKKELKEQKKGVKERDMTNILEEMKDIEKSEFLENMKNRYKGAEDGGDNW